VWLTGYKGANLSPDKLNAKTDPPFCLYFCTLLVFSRLLFSESFSTVVFRWFRVLVYRNPHPNTLSFLNLFLNVGEDPVRWPVGLFQLRFPPWLKPLATQLVYNLIFLNNFLLGCTKNAYNQRGFNNVTWTTASLPRQTLTTKLFTTHFATVGFRKLWVVWRLISLTYKYEHWKGKCVKSVLGEFNSGVSICHNKGTQSDLGAPLSPGPRGPFLRLRVVGYTKLESYVIRETRTWIWRYSLWIWWCHPDCPYIFWTVSHLFFIIWTSEIDVFSSHQQPNVQMCETLLNTWLKFYLY